MQYSLLLLFHCIMYYWIQLICSCLHSKESFTALKLIQIHHRLHQSVIEWHCQWCTRLSKAHSEALSEQFRTHHSKDTSTKQVKACCVPTSQSSG